MAENLQGFFAIGALPFDVKQNQLDDGSGLFNTLLKHEASWHKSCKDKINSTKLKRAEKRKKQEELPPHSPRKTRRTSSFGPSECESKDEEFLCFFCNQVLGTLGLQRASTLELDRKVRESAMKLKRNDLLAKLSSGDMIAIEAKYHARCLVSLYNDVRKLEIKSKSEEEKSMSSLHGIAFASLVSYLEEHRDSGETAPVFKLADLGRLNSKKLQELGFLKSCLNINTTRLKERLLAAIPDLTAHTQGKHILLVFNDAIGDAFRKACKQDYDSEALHLARAAKIVRRDMFSMQQSFKGTFEIDCQMIIEGPSIKKDNKEIEEEDKVTKAALSISQLLSFNSCKQGRAGKTVRHRLERECPLPIYTPLKIHGETRKRGLIDVMHKLGLCISYDRVMDISTDLANSVTAQFQQDGVVCPPKLRKNVFTTAGIDNIDHNPSSTTASDSFHGTAILLVQHPTATNKGTERGTNVISGTVQEVNAISELPLAFCNVPPAVLRVNDPIVPEPPSGYIRLEDGMMAPADVPEEEEFQWL